jgi:hypothetical protein
VAGRKRPRNVDVQYTRITSIQPRRRSFAARRIFHLAAIITRSATAKRNAAPRSR